MLKGNKGEWSEVYALLKLVGSQTLNSGDAKLNRIPELLYPIIKVLREENENTFSKHFKSKTKFLLERNC